MENKPRIELQRLDLKHLSLPIEKESWWWWKPALVAAGFGIWGLVWFLY